MGSGEIARTKVEIEAEMDAENSDWMDANTTVEMTNVKDAETLKTETRIPSTTGGGPHIF